MTGPVRERPRTGDGVPLGFFITLEGIEGSGKTTHARRLEAVLAEAGHRVCLTREPGGTPLGEKLRELLLGASGETPVPAAELFLILAARAQHVADVVLPHLERGEIVISDRYADASLAYQGGGRGLGVEPVARANRLATGGLVPDLTVLCTLPVERAVERVRHRHRGGGDMNRFDREAAAFYDAVQRAYLALAAAEPERFTVLDADRPKDELAADILAAAAARIAERDRAGGLAPPR